MSIYQTIAVACFTEDLQRTIQNSQSNPLIERALEQKTFQERKHIDSIRLIFANWIHLPVYPILEDNLLSDVPAIWSDDSKKIYQQRTEQFNSWLNEWLNFYRHTRPELFVENNRSGTHKDLSSERSLHESLSRHWPLMAISAQLVPEDFELGLHGFINQHCVDLMVLSNQQVSHLKGNDSNKVAIKERG